MCMRKAFCFLKGEIVECSEGRVQDCNIKKVTKCMLDEDKKKQKGFCFLKGEWVDCTIGRVQDCNIKKVTKCMLDEEKMKDDNAKREKEIKEKEDKRIGKSEGNQKGFCFYKGAWVDCSSGRVQDCNIKQVRKCIKDEEANKS